MNFLWMYQNFLKVGWIGSHWCRGIINQISGEEIASVPPTNVVNYDETIFNEDPGRSKVIEAIRTPVELWTGQNRSIQSWMLLLVMSLCCHYMLFISWNTYTNRSLLAWFDGNGIDDWLKKVLLSATICYHTSPLQQSKCSLKMVSEWYSCLLI